MNTTTSGEAESMNSQYSGAATEEPAATAANCATNGPQQPQVQDPTMAAVPTVPSVAPARLLTRHWRAMMGARRLDTMSCTDDSLTARFARGSFIIPHRDALSRVSNGNLHQQKLRAKRAVYTARDRSISVVFEEIRRPHGVRFDRNATVNRLLLYQMSRVGEAIRSFSKIRDAEADVRLLHHVATHQSALLNH